MEIIHHISKQDLYNLVDVFKYREYIDEIIPFNDGEFYSYGPGTIIMERELYRIPMWLDLLLYPEDHK